MPRGNGTGPQGQGPGTGRGRGRGFGGDSTFQKSTLGGTIFAFASMLIGNWLDKKLSKRKPKNKLEEDELNQEKKY